MAFRLFRYTARTGGRAAIFSGTRQQDILTGIRFQPDILFFPIRIFARGGNDLVSLGEINTDYPADHYLDGYWRSSLSSSIVVQLGRGNDSLSLQSSGRAHITVHGGSGYDVVTLGGVARDWHAVAVPLSSYSISLLASVRTFHPSRWPPESLGVQLTTDRPNTAGQFPGRPPWHDTVNLGSVWIAPDVEEIRYYQPANDSYSSISFGDLLALASQPPLSMFDYFGSPLA